MFSRKVKKLKSELENEHKSNDAPSKPSKKERAGRDGLQQARVEQHVKGFDAQRSEEAILPGITVMKDMLWKAENYGKGRDDRWARLLEALPQYNDRAATVDFIEEYDWRELDGNSQLYDDAVDAFLEVIMRSQQNILFRRIPSNFWHDPKNYPVTNIDDINATWLWPICDNGHWWLYVVQPSSGDVLHWDSLFNESDAAVYLKRFETAERRLEELWPQKKWRLNYRKIADQSDGSSCGVWVCVYADAIVGGVEPRATMEDMPHWRERILWALVTGCRPDLPGFVTLARAPIYVLIKNTEPLIDRAIRSQTLQEHRSSVPVASLRGIGLRPSRRAAPVPSSALLQQLCAVESKAAIYRTKSGTRIVFCPAQDQPPSLTVLFGASCDTSEGHHHMLEHMKVLRSSHPDGKGSSEFLDHALARCEIHNQGTTSIHGSVTYQLYGTHEEGIVAVLDLWLSQVLMPPVFTEADLRTELYALTPNGDPLGVLFSELEEIRRTGGTLRNDVAAAKVLFGRNFNFSGDPSGEPNDLAKAFHERDIGKELTDLHHSHYFPSNMTLMFVGSYEHQRVETEVEETLRRFTNNKLPAIGPILPNFNNEAEPNQGLFKKITIRVAEVSDTVVSRTWQSRRDGDHLLRHAIEILCKASVLQLTQDLNTDSSKISFLSLPARFTISISCLDLPTDAAIKALETLVCPSDENIRKAIDQCLFDHYSKVQIPSDHHEMLMMTMMRGLYEQWSDEAILAAFNEKPYWCELELKPAAWWKTLYDKTVKIYTSVMVMAEPEEEKQIGRQSAVPKRLLAVTEPQNMKGLPKALNMKLSARKAAFPPLKCSKFLPYHDNYDKANFVVPTSVILNDSQYIKVLAIVEVPGRLLSKAERLLLSCLLQQAFGENVGDRPRLLHGCHPGYEGLGQRLFCIELMCDLNDVGELPGWLQQYLLRDDEKGEQEIKDAADTATNRNDNKNKTKNKNNKNNDDNNNTLQEQSVFALVFAQPSRFEHAKKHLTGGRGGRQTDDDIDLLWQMKVADIPYTSPLQLGSKETYNKGWEVFEKVVEQYKRGTVNLHFLCNEKAIECLKDIKKWHFLTVVDPKQPQQTFIRCEATRLLPISPRNWHVHGFVGLTTLHASIPMSATTTADVATTLAVAALLEDFAGPVVRAIRGTGLGYSVIVDYNEALQLLTLKITCVPQPDQAIKSIRAQLDIFTLTEAIIKRSKYIAANIFYTKMMTGPQRQTALVTQLLRRDTGKRLKNQRTNKNWAPVGNEK
ncbi:unnamed protein product, partial [Mesorhabditis spiculigera]